MDSTFKIATAKDLYTGFYKRNLIEIQQGQTASLNTLRQQGMDTFDKIGFPGKKNELYKYSAIEPWFNGDFNILAQNRKIEFDVEEIFHCGVPNLETQVVLLINGFYYQKGQLNTQMRKGVWIGSLKTAINENFEWVINHFGKIANNNDPFVALNTGLFTDGIVVHIEKGQRLEKPLQVINILLSNDDLAVQHRNLIVLEENSKASIVICDHTLSSSKYVTNSVSEIFVAKGAQYEQSGMQNEHNQAASVHSTYIYQEQESKTNFVNITLHGGFVRNNHYVNLAGEYAETLASGLALTDKTQHVDNYVFIHHAKPNCTSNQLFKTILDETSTGAFNGRILVDRNSQKTIAYQKNNNLLLTREARMNTRPQLEIYADDVKCSHGATVGQLNEEAMFYLRSRGIPFNEARFLMMHAFTHEIIANISIEALRDRTGELIDKRLRGELSRCENCNFNCC